MDNDLRNNSNLGSPSSTMNATHANGATRAMSKRTLLLAFTAAAFAAWIFISLNAYG